MTEKINGKTIFSLSEVALSIQRTLGDRYNTPFWVKAEMNKLNRYPQSGHCYPDLVEKLDGKIVAEMRANIWKDDYNAINANFLKTLHEPLREGITILFAAKINFHPVYGLSLRIMDIDPSYSLGELEREKRETITKLLKEGIFGLNKEQTLSVLPSRIAVISVQTSKGYADFTKILDENPWKYKIFLMLFPALLQGEQAVTSILFQLERIRKVRHHFDAVAIIRGGGGDIGLTCYNNYELARQTALFPIPVLTGIGHSTNETVMEMIAYKNAITPTDLADFILQRYHNFSVPLQKAAERVQLSSGDLLNRERRELKQEVLMFRSLTLAGIQQKSALLHRRTESLVNNTSHYIEICRESQINKNINKLNGFLPNYFARQKLVIHHLESMTEALNPLRVLKRGYTLSMVSDRIIKSSRELREGDTMTTLFADGQSVSQVNKINITKENE